MQKVLIFEKKSVDLNPQPPECKSVALLFKLSVLWFLLEFSPLLCLQAAAECKLITALTLGDKLEVGG